MKKIRITSSIGKDLVAVIDYPEIKTPKLAILCPGYLDSKDYEHTLSLAIDLAKKDYTVVRFDPTGTWESGGNIEEYTTTQYLSDIHRTLAHMLSEGDYTHVLLAGHGWGGTVSILYAAMDSKISIVIAIMPVDSLVLGPERDEWEKGKFTVSERNMPGKEEKAIFRVPYSYIQDAGKYNLKEEIKKVHAPIIFIVGELDTAVRLEGVKEIFNQANASKKLVVTGGIIDDYRHSVPDIRKINERILQELQ